MENKCSKVLFPCDTSDHMEYGVYQYYERFHKPGNEVIFLHVDNETVHGEEDDDPSENQISHKKTLLLLQERLKKMSVKAGNMASEFIMEHHHRDIGHTIIKMAEKIKADFIVMVSKDRGKLRRTLVGTVCDNVTHNAHIPVVLIKRSASLGHGSFHH